MQARLIISHKNAVLNGFKRYFTGRACKHGHITERLISNHGCIACGTKRSLAWAAFKAALLATRARAKRAATPQKFRNYDRDRYQADPRLKMLSAAKRRAKLKGVPFDITVADIDIPVTCPLLGIPLLVGNGVMGDNSPTLDRIINKNGYVRGNIVVVSYIANRCKGSLQAVEILRIATNLSCLELKIGVDNDKRVRR